MAYETMEEELLDDLTAELEITDENFNAALLASKIKTAIRDVKRARRYPSYYTSEQIESDCYNFYTNVRMIALNDYNKAGIESETSHNENSVSAGFVDRDKLFAGIIPLAK